MGGHGIPFRGLSPALFQATPEARVVTVVLLNVYNIGQSCGGKAVNGMLRPLGTGFFHCGVEIFGREWSYGEAPASMSTGIFWCWPRNCKGHNYFESYDMGMTAISEREVLQIIHVLMQSWDAKGYDTLHRNCCHFANELCQRLGVGTIPTWVRNLAELGASIAETTDPTCCCQVAKKSSLVMEACLPKLVPPVDSPGPISREMIVVARKQPLDEQ